MIKIRQTPDAEIESFHELEEPNIVRKTKIKLKYSYVEGFHDWRLLYGLSQNFEVF